MAKREKIEFKYHDGSLIPASNYAKSLLQQRNFKDGQVVRAELSKLRSNGLNKHAHNIANLCIDHIDDFKEYVNRAHDALKRLQLESGAECDELMIRIAGLPEKVIAKQARSLSYENMGEERFQDAIKVICRHICDVYWQKCTPDQVEMMAEQNAMVNE